MIATQLNLLDCLQKPLANRAYQQKLLYGSNTLPISFGWTSDVLLQGLKTQTRRQWTDKRLECFIKYFDQQRIVPALNKQKCYGGSQIGWVMLTQKPYLQPIKEMPESDVSLEGYPSLSQQEFVNKFFTKLNPETQLVVINFEFEPL